MPQLNGWRGAGLLVVSLASCLTRGIRYTFQVPDDLPAGIDQLSFGGAIIQGLGVLWLAAAALGVWAAFRLHDLPGVFALASMHALWSVALFLGWVFEAGDWLTSVTTAGVFGLIVCWSRMVNPPRAGVETVEELLDQRTGGE